MSNNLCIIECLFLTLSGWDFHLSQKEADLELYLQEHRQEAKATQKEIKAEWGQGWAGG